MIQIFSEKNPTPNKHFFIFKIGMITCLENTIVIRKFNRKFGIRILHKHPQSIVFGILKQTIILKALTVIQVTVIPN